MAQDSVAIQSFSLDTAPGNFTVEGNLTVTGNTIVNGTTTTVNSTVVTIDDPIFTLGGDTAPGSDDNKDRGIEFRYHDGSARVGFFGYDDSSGFMTFLKAATNSSEVFSGTLGTMHLGAIQIGSSNPFSDSTGTLTLQNVDVLDATTEATIEAAIDTLASVTSIGAAGATTNFVAGDLTVYNAVNDGNPTISLGSASAERLIITTNYDSSAQTLNTVEFATAAASGTANKGKFVFDVDGTDILDIDDSGINLVSGKTFRINGTAISSGDFSGPGSATDNAIVRFDGTGGKTGQGSSILIDDSNNMAGVVSLASAADSALTISADTDIVFKIDADNDGTETYQFQNGGGSNVMVIDEASNVTATTFVGNLTGNVTGNTSGTAATVTTAAQTNITSLGTLTALTVDDVAVNGKIITMTGSTSDTATITAGTNGTLAIATTDAAANAGNITITADGSIGLDSVTDMGFDAATGIFTFSDGGTEVLRITESNSGDVTIKTAVNAKDLIFTDNGDATNMKILDGAAGINVPGEVQTTGIGYTDGDNAITIADGGGITAAAGITSTAASNSFGASSFGDAAITNVGDIALDSISADGTDINIATTDNSATALTIKQGSDAYLIIDTANSSESVSVGTGISGTAITLGHSTSETTVADNLTVTGSVDHTLDAHFDSSPADETVSGFTATFTAGEDLVRGEVVYFKAGDSKMWKAVATAIGTMPVAAMAAADISADAAGKFLLFGFLADNGSFPAYTVGGDLYAPEAETSSQNVPEQAAPDSDGDFVQVLGYAVTANSIFFDPDQTIVEVA